MKIFKLTQTKVLLVITLIAFYGMSCKKSSVGPAKKPIVLVNDSITQNGYTLIFINLDTTFQVEGDAVRKGYESTFFAAYPKVCAYFNPNGPKKVTFIIDDSFKAQEEGEVAGAHGDNLVSYNPVYALGNPTDFNIVVHEITHVDQQYVNPDYYAPSYFIEGIADYSKAKFGVPGAFGGWYIPDYQSGQSYELKYTVTARFLQWAEAKYHVSCAQVVDSAMRNGTYDDDATWVALTGSTFLQLWTSYTTDPYF
jgi:hypothetical protein